MNPPAEAIALDGAQRAWRFIRTAVKDGSDRQARWEMMMAALEGGLTFQKGLGAVHSLSHAAGAIRDPILHHGMLNGVFLPHILRFNAGHVGDKYATLRGLFGLAPDADLAAAVQQLVQELGLPVTLGAMGFREEHIAVNRDARDGRPLQRHHAAPRDRAGVRDAAARRRCSAVTVIASRGRRVAPPRAKQSRGRACWLHALAWIASSLRCSH